VLELCVTCILRVPQLHSKGSFELHCRGTCELHNRDAFDMYCRGTAKLYSASIGSLIFPFHIIDRYLPLSQFPVSHGSHILVWHIADNKVLLTVFQERAAYGFPRLWDMCSSSLPCCYLHINDLLVKLKSLDSECLSYHQHCGACFYTFCPFFCHTNKIQVGWLRRP
jgi:hypothetical protein